MYMKKLLCLFLCVVLTASLAACAGGKGGNNTQTANGVTNEAKPDGEDASGDGGQANAVGLLVKGKLMVGMEISYPPFEYFTDDGTPIGLDIDLSNAIAEKLGIGADNVEFVNTDFNAILSGLDANKYDVAISAVTIDAERSKAVDFTTPYIENWQNIVVKAGSAPVDSLEALEGKKVGMQDGTTSAGIVDDMIASGQLATTEKFLYDSVLNAFDDLALGRIDCVLTDSTVAAGYLEREVGKYEISWNQQDVPGAVAEEFGIAVKKGNAALLEAVNKALAELEASGTLDGLRDEWLS
jgi:polar amino acid transport system substrate-binding protein